jgi:outer membrane protein assembly factor BamA
MRGHHPFRQEATLIEARAPYGSGEFDELLATLRLEADTRDDVLMPRGGFRVEAEATVAPALLDVRSTYGTLEGTVAAYRGAGDGVPGRPVLAVRAGGRIVQGTPPYHAAAFVGGPSTVRGFRQERFAGDASLFAGAELRAFLTEFVFLLPGDLGLLALADAGRVFLDGDDSSTWHGAWGGGVWVSFLDAFAATVSFARSREDTMVYFVLGMPF